MTSKPKACLCKREILYSYDYRYNQYIAPFIEKEMSKIVNYMKITNCMKKKNVKDNKEPKLKRLNDKDYLIILKLLDGTHVSEKDRERVRLNLLIINRSDSVNSIIKAINNVKGKSNDN